MNLLPLLYALLAAITGIAAGGAPIGEPRVAASPVGQTAQAVAVAAARLVAAPSQPAFERLRPLPVATIAAVAPRLAVAFLPADERPARRRE